ncbi:DUF2281 domain-containing protein [Coleofasciculus chthonoplastes]|uniref:DUF2281 domain-containing protein n=2 Tax=Coleofasciculaceae TaxID=1892251 RepID=UPI0032F47884
MLWVHNPIQATPDTTHLLMTTAEAVYELVKALPEDQANMVLAFAEFLRQKFQLRPSPRSQLLSSYLGILKDSPNLNEDPVEIQHRLRSEWK